MPLKMTPGRITKAVIVEIPENLDSISRVKVRIPEFHGPFKQPTDKRVVYVPDKYLPLADVCLPLGQVGSALTINEVVYVTFLNSEVQLPIIIGTTGVILSQEVTGREAAGYWSYSNNGYYYDGSGRLVSSAGSTDIVEFALSQVGSNGANSWRYWYGNSTSADHWCMMFVCYCAYNCGYIATKGITQNNLFGDDGLIPKTASCGVASLAFNNAGLWRYRGNYIPRPGDLIYFKWTKDGRVGKCDHVGIVCKVENGKVFVVHGNSSGDSYSPYYRGSKVTTTSFDLTNKAIVGYGTPNYPSKYSEETISGSDDTYHNLQIIYDVLKQFDADENAISGLSGNWYSESNIRSNCIEGDHLNGFNWNSLVNSDGTFNQRGVNSFCNNILVPSYSRSNISINESFYRNYTKDTWYPGIGLGQWTGSRNKELQIFSNQVNMKWYEIGTQLAYMMTPPGANHGDSSYSVFMKYLGNRIGSSGKDSIKFYKTPEEAAYKFFSYWEQPGRGLSYDNFVSDDREGRRAINARKIYNMIPDLDKGTYRQSNHDELINNIISSIR